MPSNFSSTLKVANWLNYNSALDVFSKGYYLLLDISVPHQKGRKNFKAVLGTQNGVCMHVQLLRFPHDIVGLNFVICSKAK